MIPIYYINLDSRPDRRRYMDEQFAALGLVAERLVAATPLDVTAADADRYCNPARPAFLRRNELACTMSHEWAWQKMIEHGHERVLILEDDAELSSRLPAFLAEAGAIDADLIRIETTGAPMRVFPVLATGASGIAVRPFRSTPRGTAGYILRAGAARMLLANPHLRLRALDLALFDPFAEPGRLLHRVTTDPALCRQLNMSAQRTMDTARSDIADTDIEHAYARRHPLHHGLARLATAVRGSLRNMTDHMVQKRHGLERRVVPFAE